MKIRIVVAALFVASIAAPAGATDVATFLARMETLKSKGVAAVFSSDLRSLMGEIQESMTALKAERMAAVKAGRRPAYCPRDKAELSREELFGSMQGIPVADRSKVQVKDALRGGLARKYPCAGRLTDRRLNIVSSLL